MNLESNNSKIIGENLESNIQKYKEFLKRDNGKLVSRIKRPIIIDTILPNEIYITRRIPIYVYYKRAISLLRQQMVHQLYKPDNIKSENIGKADNRELYKLIQDKNCNLKELLKSGSSWGTKGIKIHAAGACIKSAFYLLQDIIQHYYQQLQSQNNFQEIQPSKKKCERFGGIPTLQNESLESIEEKIAKFLNIKITSKSILCTDDLYINNFGINNDMDAMPVDQESAIEVRRN